MASKSYCRSSSTYSKKIIRARCAFSRKCAVVSHFVPDQVSLKLSLDDPSTMNDSAPGTTSSLGANVEHGGNDGENANATEVSLLSSTSNFRKIDSVSS